MSKVPRFCHDKDVGRTLLNAMGGQSLVCSRRNVDRFFEGAVGGLVLFVVGEGAEELAKSAVEVLHVLDGLALVFGGLLAVGNVHKHCEVLKVIRESPELRANHIEISVVQTQVRFSFYVRKVYQLVAARTFVALSTT